MFAASTTSGLERYEFWHEEGLNTWMQYTNIYKIFIYIYIYMYSLQPGGLARLLLNPRTLSQKIIKKIWVSKFPIHIYYNIAIYMAKSKDFTTGNLKLHAFHNNTMFTTISHLYIFWPFFFPAKKKTKHLCKFDESHPVKGASEAIGVSSPPQLSLVICLLEPGAVSMGMGNPGG